MQRRKKCFCTSLMIILKQNTTWEQFLLLVDSVYLYQFCIVQPLSILCRSLRDIDTYTTGFPRGTNQGQANIFRAVKRVIPGPVSISSFHPWPQFCSTSQMTCLFNPVQYTFILPATKELPKQCIRHGSSTRYAKRRQVGVRLPDDPICEAILQNLDEPLICTRLVQAVTTFFYLLYLFPALCSDMLCYIAEL